MSVDDDLDEPRRRVGRRHGLRARPEGVFDGLLDRYRPAYKAATNLQGLAVLVGVLGVFGILGGGVGCKGAHNELEANLDLMVLIAGVTAIVFGLVLNAFGSILRARLDATVFVAVGLSDQEKIDLVFKPSAGALAEQGPRPCGDGAAPARPLQATASSVKSSRALR